MGQWLLGKNADETSVLPPETLPPGQPGLPAHLPSFVPALLALVTATREELEAHVERLLTLNPSRREAVAAHLTRMLPTAGPADLKQWVEGPRTHQQDLALSSYFTETALVAVGQAIVLKAWSDRGLRHWSEKDLVEPNYTLATALHPHVPLDREGWQITRQNIYCWYKPGPSLRKELWKTLEQWRISDEGPALLGSLLRLARQPDPDLPMPAELKSYDPRFFSLLWERMGSFGIDLSSPVSSPLKRKRSIFSPTLRDGSMVRTGPASVSWTGLENHPFQLLVAELVQLWWGPAAPPVWAQGTGLEVHAREQLQLALGSPKPSLFSRIGEMESCDVSLVLEERTLRLGARTPDGSRLRAQLDQLPYFRKLRGPNTALGALQACVALTKLRPGGLLWWAREEPLGEDEGREVLGFLLERGKLLCEWDLSGLEHQMPVVMPPYPKRLYLFQREPQLQERLSHHPVRISLTGQVRSHIEVPVLLEDALAAFSGATEPRAHWQVHVQRSPTAQQEWGERWPDPTARETLRKLERLKAGSSPLASACTVRATPAGDPAKGGAWSVHATLKGLWLRTDSHGPDGERRLVAEALPRPGKESKGSGFLVLVADESWVAPLSAYLSGGEVRRWLDHHAERRGQGWALSEQVMRFIPVPKPLLHALGGQAEGEPESAGGFAVPLPGEWERLAAELPYQPRLALAKLAALPPDDTSTVIRAAVFVRASRALEHLKSTQGKLLSLVGADGRIRWRELFDLLPKGHFGPVTTHPLVRLSGTLPPQIPIARFDRVRVPMPGVMLATESGFHLHVGCENARLLDMLWDQLDGLEHPTWSELVDYLRLPRQLDAVEKAAEEVIKSHGDQMTRLQSLSELISACFG